MTTLEFCLVLLVAAIPVAMPTVLSVTMAVGARLLSKKEVVVTKLSAIEELAGVDILCSDKTGTLTQNKLTLGDPFTVNSIPGDQVVLWAALASRAEDKDTIDLAVIGGVKDDKALKSNQVTHFVPFDPVHKRTEATVKGADGKQFFVAKGAPQIILQMATNAGEVKAAVEKAILDFAGKGFRSLGVARADEEGKWKFAGMLSLFDPPREQAKATIASAVEMGVKVKMVTGDQIAIAQETAKQLGMGTNILNASGLGDSKKDATPEQAKAIEDADGFAQVFPEHKFHIIQVLQRRGHFVGMTGDGVNDAPALKQADCGIAVSGSDRRGARCGIHRAAGARTVGHHRRDQGSPENCPADEQLCDLPHRRNAACVAVHDTGNPDLQFLSSDSGNDRADRSAQRRSHPIYRVRQCSLQEGARGLEHAPGAGDCLGAGPGWTHCRVWPVLPWRPRLSPRAVLNCRH